jgi:threonine aldolase
VDRLVEDHANARLIAEHLAADPAFEVDLASVQTNIIVFGLAPSAPDAPTLVARARAAGVLIVALGPRVLRAVTHLDVTRDDSERAAAVLVEAVRGVG